MPVPSTMIGSRETIVGSPYGLVTSATARIIGIGPDREAAREAGAGLDQLLEPAAHEAVVAERAVVGADVVVVAHRLEQVAQDHELGCARTDDRRDDHASRVQLAGQREDGPGAEAAADEHGVPALRQCDRQPERACEVEDLVALLQGADQAARPADLLDDERDRAGRRVEVRDADRHALAGLGHADDDELAGARVVRDARRAHHEELGDLGQVPFLDHCGHCVPHRSGLSSIALSRCQRRSTSASIDASTAAFSGLRRCLVFPISPSQSATGMRRPSGSGS